MSDKNEGYSSSSFWQLIIAIPGSIIGFTLLIALLAHFLAPSKTESVSPAPTKLATAEPAQGAESPQAAGSTQVEQNIKPDATAEVAPVSTGPHVDKNGEEVVKAVCAMCHATGLMEAPKIGDAAQWQPRIALGYETLVNHAINGIRNMPARGGNPDLTDGEVANAVAYMADQAGAKFDPATLKK